MNGNAAAQSESDDIMIEKQKKAKAWNATRQNILKTVQTILGVSIVLTVLFVQYLILFVENVKTPRMITQAVFVFICCLLTYLIVIGISNI